MAKTVLVPIAEGTEELEAVCMIDTLVRAGLEVVVASVEKNRRVKASRGVLLTAQVLIDQALDRPWDLIALPGGAPGSRRLGADPSLKTLLLAQAAAKKPIAALCAAPALVLSKYDLLSNHLATCYPTFRHRLKAKAYLDQPVVTDGPFVTGQGPGAALPFSLALVQLLCDPEKQRSVANAMLAPLLG